MSTVFLTTRSSDLRPINSEICIDAGFYSPDLQKIWKPIERPSLLHFVRTSMDVLVQGQPQGHRGISQRNENPDISFVYAVLDLRTTCTCGG